MEFGDFFKPDAGNFAQKREDAQKIIAECQEKIKTALKTESPMQYISAASDLGKIYNLAKQYEFSEYEKYHREKLIKLLELFDYKILDINDFHTRQWQTYIEGDLCRLRLIKRKYERAEQKEEIIASFQKWSLEWATNFSQWRNNNNININELKAHISESGKFEISGVPDQAIQMRILFLGLGINLL